MPLPPAFDYYAELQIERSASLTEITSAYRRLARIHHPDKNPDNQEEATAIFQRLQLAHETLSDPFKRALYDDEGDELFASDPFDPDPFEPDLSTFPFPFGFFFFPGVPPRSRFAQTQAAERKRRESEARVKREEQRQRQEAKEAREKEAKRNEALAKRQLRDEELKKQQKRWEEMGAISEDGKLGSCLHSDVCEKVKHNKKFKCTACTEKRSMIAFECPHCSASLCPLCVKTFSERRKRLETKEQMGKSNLHQDYAGIGGSPNFDEEKTNKPNGNETRDDDPHIEEPMTGGPAAKKPKKKKPNAQKAKTDGSFEQTPISGKNGNNHQTNHKDNNPGSNKAHEGQEAHTSGASFASENPYDILARSNETTDATGSGPTGGYIRTLSRTPMPPTAILRQAIERFGAVSSLRVSNKRLGIAHVEFATHDGLCRAMAASPVFVSETVNVRVAELKHCHTCGKEGHDAETCRARRRKTQGPA